MPLAKLQAARRPAQLLAIPDGPDGVRATLEVMRRLVREGRNDPDVQALAIELTAGIRDTEENRQAAIEALHRFVRDEVRYVPDVNEVETLRTAHETLFELAAGDCDDKSIALASLLEAIGIPARFVAVAFSPDLFDHVYVEARFNWRGAEWMPLETTKAVEPGWEPGGVVSRMHRHVS